MCVTNTTSRRPPAIALAPEMVANSSSMLSQRLFGNIFSTVETGNNACAAPVQAEQPTSFPCDFYSTGASVDQTKLEKARPKRRRKPQKPGKTAKQNDRHFVVHNYHDHANDPDENDAVVVEEEAPVTLITFPPSHLAWQISSATQQAKSTLSVSIPGAFCLSP